VLRLPSHSATDELDAKCLRGAHKAPNGLDLGLVHMPALDAPQCADADPGLEGELFLRQPG
jgi:hypothetical protein